MSCKEDFSDDESCGDDCAGDAALDDFECHACGERDVAAQLSKKMYGFLFHPTCWNSTRSYLRSFQEKSLERAEAINDLQRSKAKFQASVRPWLNDRKFARSEQKRKFQEMSKVSKFSVEEVMEDDLLPTLAQYVEMKAAGMSKQEAEADFKSIRVAQKAAYDAKDGTHRIKVQGIAKLRKRAGTSSEDSWVRKENSTEEAVNCARKRLTSKTSNAVWEGRADGAPSQSCPRATSPQSRSSDLSAPILTMPPAISPKYPEEKLPAFAVATATRVLPDTPPKAIEARCNSLCLGVGLLRGLRQCVFCLFSGGVSLGKEGPFVFVVPCWVFWQAVLVW